MIFYILAWLVVGFLMCGILYAIDEDRMGAGEIAICALLGPMMVVALVGLFIGMIVKRGVAK